MSKLKNKGGKWKYMTEKEMLEVAAKFSPYRSVLFLPGAVTPVLTNPGRSLFMWYMWRILENVDISILEKN